MIFGILILFVWVCNVHLFNFKEFGFHLQVIVGDGKKVGCIRLKGIERKSFRVFFHFI